MDKRYIPSKEVLLSCQGFHKCFQQNAEWFLQANKTIRTELLYEKNSLSPRLSNQTYQVIVTAGQHGQCPALTETTCLNCIQMNNNRSIMYFQVLIVNRQLRLDSNISVT